MEGSGHRTGGRHEADLADSLDPVRRIRLRALDEHHLDVGDVLRAQDPELPQGRGHGEAGLGIMREFLGQRVAEAHVDRTLDLALAQHRVHGPADVVHGDDLLERTGLAIDDRHLGGVGERRVDDRVLHARGAELGGPVDAVLADIVDTDLAPARAGCFASGLHRSGPHECAAAPGGLAEPEFARGVHVHTDPRRIDAEFLDGDLERHGVHALAHLGPAVAHLDDAVLAEVDDRLGDLLEAVPEAAVLQTEPQTHGLAGRDGFVVVRLHRVEAGFGSEAAVVHDLARAPHLARMDHVALAHLPAADANELGEAVHAALHGELGLVGPEPAERAAHGVVRTDRRGVHGDRRQPIRPARMPGGSFDDLHADARVGPGIADHLDLHPGQLAGVGTADRVLHPDRMALGVHAEALLPGERALHRTLQEPGRQRGVGLVRHVLLAAEGTAVRDELDGHLIVADAEHGCDLVAVVPHTLAAGVHVQAAVVTDHGERALGLEEGVLDPLGLERLGDHVRAARQLGLDVAA